MGAAAKRAVRHGPKEVAIRDAQKTRLNLVYKGNEVELLLDKLQRLGNHGTVTEAVARALRVYEAMLDEREKGNTVVVRGRDGSLVMRLIA